MQCLNNKIKSEDCEIRTVVVAGSNESQKIILSPRVEFHRVIKTDPSDNELIKVPSVSQVRVIKDGRFYEESRHFKDNNGINYSTQQQQQQNIGVQEPRKYIVSRQVNVISSGDSNETIFRPPIVSSTSNPLNPMRPPPPPPPPKLKCVTTEEPSSSIPDLGESISFFFLFDKFHLSII